MDRVQAASLIIKDLNLFFAKEMTEDLFLKRVCSYFDGIKGLELTSADYKFLKYIANISGVPHYYDLLFSRFGHKNKLTEYDLNTFSSVFYESSLHIDENIKIHKFQKKILDQFDQNRCNKYFLSATTSFGKTFLIYEIIKKLKYKNVALIFPTIALLAENYERLLTNQDYSYFHQFNIHTLSDIQEFSDKNIFIFTPERYLSFIDKYKEVQLDFVFIDEIYKIDNEYLIDQVNQENERDTAYRIALNDILKKTCDILLVGPYIEFPDKNNKNLNQSFNIFLQENNFRLLDYNKFEIVAKNISIIKNKNTVADDSLVLNLKQCSKKDERVVQIISSIRNINENVLLYTKGYGTAESRAKYIIKTIKIKDSSLHVDLKKFIDHLKQVFNFKDDFGNIWIVVRALQNKIGIHHGLVPKYIQKEIVSLFNLGYLDVLISTTTITEGVNTSAKNLIVYNSSKGTKELKKFDAKNIVGRAGRFLHHYSGRVLILDEKFNNILTGCDSEIKHKNYDTSSVKNEIDYFITDNKYLSPENIRDKESIILCQKKLDIPDEIMSMFKVIGYSDKIYIFQEIMKISQKDLLAIKNLIKSTNFSPVSIDFDGLMIVLNIISPIVKNKTLKFFIENKTSVKHGRNAGKSYSTLVYMLSAYLQGGFLGSVKYNLTRVNKNGKKFTIDESIRFSSSFIFNILKYQLVKYLGVFNIMYKYSQAILLNKDIDDLLGIDKLLLKLEYNAMSDKGRLASDYGAPSKIIEYYEKNENIKIFETFDSFEKEKFSQIEKVINKRSV